MATFTFKTTQLRQLLADARRAWEQDDEPNTLYGTVVGKGFFLVGDDGVYIMHNGKTHIGKDGAVGSIPLFVVYAQECPPDDDDAKRALWGGDDGAEFISLAEMTRWLVGLDATRKLKLTATQLRLELPPLPKQVSFADLAAGRLTSDDTMSKDEAIRATCAAFDKAVRS